MKIIIDIPDDLAQRITAAGDDLPRFVLELFGINEYKKGHLTTEELRRLLGFRTRMQLDGFLKQHGVFIEYTMADFEQEREELRRLGF
jgi:hypothetical protein